MDKRKIIPTTEAEARFWAAGYAYVAGLDEAGRGAWAGPVYAAAVILPQNPELLSNLDGVRDSKLLSPSRRAELLEQIVAVAQGIGIGWASAEDIDKIGIVPATRLAMHRALAALPTKPQALIIDALRLTDSSLPQQAFAYADVLCLSVAAAGIVAKVNRDRWMTNIDPLCPGYAFARHKGYGTRQHSEALEQLGVSPVHRRSFAPIAAQLKKQTKGNEL
ncbi:MAG: ribonuclease HII [Anaerolineae bacterium]|nr:ribonuclease HII [Anaerolineae bacterium]